MGVCPNCHTITVKYDEIIKIYSKESMIIAVVEEKNTDISYELANDERFSIILPNISSYWL